MLGRARLTLITALLLSGAIPELLTMGFSPLTPYFVLEFSLTESQIGLLGASMGAGSLALSVPAGRFVDEQGWKKVLMAGAFISAFSFVALSLAGGFVGLIAVLFLAGAFRPFSDIASTKATMLAVPGPEQTTAVGVVHVGPSLSSVLTSMLLPLMAAVVGWRAGLQLGAVTLIPVGYWLCWVLSRQHPGTTASEPQLGQSLAIVTIPGFWRCLAIWGSFMSANFAFLTFFILHLTGVSGMSPQAAGALLAAAQVVAMVGRPLWGLVSDRCFGGRRVQAALIMAITGTCVFVALAFTVENPVPGIPAAIAVAAGASIMSSRPVGTTLAMEYVPAESGGQALALLSLMTWTVAMILPPFLGWIITFTGTWAVAWIVSAAITATSIPLLIMLIPAGSGSGS